MIYLDHGATSFPKPRQVRRAVKRAQKTCANPGRGGYAMAMAAAEQVYSCREQAGKLFHCEPEQAVMTGNCTQGLNMAIHSLFDPGDRVVISGFEHNAVVRTLEGMGLRTITAGRKLFDWQDSLEEFEKALAEKPQGAVFTLVSNVFGYILPFQEMARMCRDRNIPFILDAAQAAGTMDIDFEALGADFLAMPGHKGLLGPMGTGLLLCRNMVRPFLYGGTGTQSALRQMPDFLPEGLEAGTLNVPGIAGLAAGIRLVRKLGPEKIGEKEQRLMKITARGLRALGMQVFAGDHQAGVLSFLPGMDPQLAADLLAQEEIALRAGLHCAPLAHESAGTLQTGTLRLSFGFCSKLWETQAFLRAAAKHLRPEV